MAEEAGLAAAAAQMAALKGEPPKGIPLLGGSAGKQPLKAASSPPNPFRVTAAADLPNPFHAAAAAGGCRRASAPAQAQAAHRAGDAARAPSHHMPPGSATPSQQLSALTAIGSLALSDAGRLTDAAPLPPAQQHPVAAAASSNGLLAKLQARRGGSQPSRWLSKCRHSPCMAMHLNHVGC